MIPTEMSSGVIYLLLRELQTRLINSRIIPFVKNAIPYQTKGLGKKVMLTIYQIALASKRKPSRRELLNGAKPPRTDPKSRASHIG